MPGPLPVQVQPTDAERSERLPRQRRCKIAPADTIRTEILLLAAAGMRILAVARQLATARMRVAASRKRSTQKRLDRLSDVPRPGALRQRPRGATHWNVRSTDCGMELTLFTIHRIRCAISLQPHRSETFKLPTDPLFVDTVEKTVPDTLDARVIMDHASDHRTRMIRNWFTKLSCGHRHFTPISASWIDQVEWFFALLTGQKIKCGARRSTKGLQVAIVACIGARNANPKPFRRTKTTDDILAAVQRFCHRPNTMCIGIPESGHQ